jgi:prepilin-type N-terminal cleavage/methylation domain-containing protein
MQSRRRRSVRGFTLVELAIVVVIAGILAVLAVVGYRRFVRRSHLAEATSMTGSIRAAQEAHKAETGLYADISNDTSSYYPAANPGPFATQWGGPCNTTCKDPNGWKHLQVNATAPVMFGYATVAGVGANVVSASSSGGSSSGAGPNIMSSSGGSSGGGGSSSGVIGPSDPFYSTVAYGDPDGDGMPTKVLGFSQSGDLIIQGE